MNGLQSLFGLLVIIQLTGLLFFDTAEGFKPPLTGFKLDDFDNGLILDGDLEYLKDGKLKAWIKLKEFPSNIKVNEALARIKNKSNDYEELTNKTWSDCDYIEKKQSELTEILKEKVLWKKCPFKAMTMEFKDFNFDVAKFDDKKLFEKEDLIYFLSILFKKDDKIMLSIQFELNGPYAKP